MRRFVPALFLLLVSLVPALAAHAQSWPVRPVRVIVSQAAGGTPDIIARLVSERLTRALGQSVLVENRPGAANIIGAQAAARAPADGYTLFFATTAALVSNPLTFKTLPYDPVKDFVPVGFVGKAPFLVLVNSSVPAKSLAELFALEKSQPGKFSVAIDGARNFSGMIAAWLNKLSGAQIQAVPYNTMPQGVQDTLAGRTQIVVIAIPSATPHMKSGALRALAVTTAQRAPGLESVPAVAETMPGFELVGWFGFMAPSGTPPEIVQRLNTEIGRILGEPEVAQRLRDLGILAEGAMSVRGFEDLIRADRATWARMVKDIGIEPE